MTTEETDQPKPEPANDTERVIELVRKITSTDELPVSPEHIESVKAALAGNQTS